MTLTHLPPSLFLFQAESRTRPGAKYVVNLAENGYAGKCDCRRNRLSKMQCFHIRTARDLFWSEVAPNCPALARLTTTTHAAEALGRVR